MSVEVGSLTQLEPVLDAIPTPLLLIEPGTARMLYVNPAAHRLAGGRMDKAPDADYAAVYGVFDPSGRRLASEEHARGGPYRIVAHLDDIPGRAVRFCATAWRAVGRKERLEIEHIVGLAKIDLSRRGRIRWYREQRRKQREANQDKTAKSVHGSRIAEALVSGREPQPSCASSLSKANSRWSLQTPFIRR